jgi:predicted nucleic acid-binding protein
MSRVGLLDVNVLIALFDPDHVHHEIAHVDETTSSMSRRAPFHGTDGLKFDNALRYMSFPPFRPFPPFLPTLDVLFD